MTPTARSLALLRRSGFTADVVERWVPVANVRRDLFGCGDVLGVHPVRREMLLVQATTAANVSSRLRKATAQPALRAWLSAGGRFEVWGWGQSRAGRWHVRRVEVRGDDMAAVPLTARRGRRAKQQPQLF